MSSVAFTPNPEVTPDRVAPAVQTRADRVKRRLTSPWATIAALVIAVLWILDVGVDVHVGDPARAVQDPGRGLCVPLHLPGHDDVRSEPAVRKCGAQHAGLLVAGGGEIVVVGGAERRLSVPDQEDAAHVAISPASRCPMVCTAGPNRAYISLLVWPWKYR